MSKSLQHHFMLLLLEVLLLLVAIEYHNGIRIKRNLLRQAIVMPRSSPWTHLYHNADDDSFFMMTGVTREVFNMLLAIVYPPPDPSSLRSRRGRPRSLLAHSELGMFLFFIGSTMQIKYICILFGCTPSVCSRVLRRLLKTIPRKLRNHDFSKVVFPDEEKMAEYATMIQLREPVAHDVIGFMDGVAVLSECTSETIEQNAMYSGYYSDTVVNNVIAYGADGKVFLCAINFPGSWHDGSICTNILPFIRERIGSYKVCVDQGFPRSGDADGVLVGPISRRSASRLSPILRDYVLRLSNSYVSLRQASEWGMRGLQGSFPRFKKRLPSDKSKRKRILQSIIYIHNFRTHIIGCNQIKTVFDPEYERVFTLNGSDRITRYYNFEGEDL